MKKAGEKVQAFFIHALFVAIVVLGLLFVVSEAKISGYAVLDTANASDKLESALSTAAFSDLADGTSMCVIIADPEAPLSLQAVKSGENWKITETYDYCSGLENEDIIVQFPDHDSFADIADNPSPRNIANSAIHQDFQILPSKNIELGGNVICDSVFELKFCDSLKQFASAEELIEGDLSCCIGELSKTQKQLLEKHMESGTYKDERSAELQSTSGFAGFFSLGGMLIGGVIFLILVILVIVILMRGKKSDGSTVTSSASSQKTAQQTPVTNTSQDVQISQLKSYTDNMLAQGYSSSEIQSYLLSIGWDSNTIDTVLKQSEQGTRT